MSRQWELEGKQCTEYKCCSVTLQPSSSVFGKGFLKKKTHLLKPVSSTNMLLYSVHGWVHIANALILSRGAAVD